MAPEIIRRQPYNLSVDVYSFSILLWQMCTLRVPFAEYIDIKDFNHDIANKGKRPRFSKKHKKLLPEALRQLMVSCWSDNIFERPTISFLIWKLKEELQMLQAENDDNHQVDISDRLEDRYYRRRSSTGMNRRLSLSSTESGM